METTAALDEEVKTKRLTLGTAYAAFKALTAPAMTPGMTLLGLGSNDMIEAVCAIMDTSGFDVSS
jgi:hypothetical protein